MFSLFSVVTFKNSGCRSTSGTTGSGVNRNGTCYTRTECQNKGGTAGGSCAAAGLVLKHLVNSLIIILVNFSPRFGICCLFISKASGTISENCTYIQNPGFPTAYTTLSTVSWTVNKCSNGIEK